MTSRISHTTVNALNAYDQSVWWSKVLGDFCILRSDVERAAAR